LKRRSLAWVTEKWIMGTRPTVIILENVEEFKKWGPLNSAGEVIKSQEGTTFAAFVRMFRRYGYRVEHRELRACDYGAPTIRNRLFLIARCDGMPIVWPEPTHGPGLIPYRTAAEIIDWSRPCPSIFERKRPLAENTLKRIAEGIRRYVLESPAPFIISYYGPKKDGEFRGLGLGEPLPTQSTENRFGLVTPHLVNLTHGGRTERADSPLRTVTCANRGEKALVIPHLSRQFGNSVGHAADEPTGTVTAGGGGKTALVSAFLTKHFGTTIGQPAGDPVSTLTGKGKHSLIASHLIKLKGTNRHGLPVDEPLHTVQAGGLHYGAVYAFLTKYFGTAIGQECGAPAHTVTSKDRLGLVIVEISGEPYVVTDIGLRMLSPRELFRAQGFEDTYIIDVDIDGKRITKTDQVRLCGNSVPPPDARALARENCLPGAEELSSRFHGFA
jgi:DNA (cytosine-5)-methyltransferase 1